MPTIACLGWGSLIWDSKELPIQRPWFADGPLVRAEFLRKSGNGRITLVLDESVPPVRSLWSIMDLTDLPAAVTALRKREDVLEKNEEKDIGRWQTGEDSPSLIMGLPLWAQSRGINAVIWTALPHKFHSSGETPTVEEIVAYLRGLTGCVREDAERYIRFAPSQIDTEYRRRIEGELNWTSVSSCFPRSGKKPGAVNNSV